MNARILMSLGFAAALVTAACDPTITPGKAGAGEIGAECTAPESCTQVSGAQCLAMGASGYCAKDCSGLGQFDCPSGAICEQLGDQAVLCMDGCCSQDDCRDGFRCARRPELDIYVDLAVCAAPGICLLRCTNDASCSQGEVCNVSDGTCVPRVGVNSGVGAGCSADAQCNSGRCLTSYPGGYCTSACGTQLTECEPGSECYAWRDGTPTCMSRCQTDGQCRSGYRCEVSATEGNGESVRAFCVPRCDTFGSCEDGTSCDGTTGRCVAGQAAPGPIGVFCDDGSDCQSGQCEASWPNGYCTATCGTCPGGSSCVDGRCLDACATANDCRFGYICSDGGCQPGCKSDADCGAGLTCDTASGECAAPSAGTTIQEFASRGVQVTDGGSEEVTFTVPPNALSTVIQLSDGQSTLMAILKLYGPGDTLLYDIQSPALSRLTFLPSEGTFTAMFPNGPAVNLVPGTYRVTFVRETGSVGADVRVFGKVSTGFPTTQTLALAFYFVEGPAGIDAAAARTNASFQAAVAEFSSIYAKLGITLGPPTYEDLPNAAALRTIDTTDGAGSELSQVFARGTRDDTLQFYFVDEILGGSDGYTILGIAGGIPGPPGIARGPHSGVAVTLAGQLAKPAQLGQVMAHEGAHYLGLFHTSEATGTTHDPLPDTAQCPSSRDSNWDGYVAPEECSGFGADNFMFWAASGTSRGTSAEQGKVIRRNPLTR